MSLPPPPTVEKLQTPCRAAVTSSNVARSCCLVREPDAVKVCAAERGVESLTQSGGARRNAPGSSD